MAAYERERKLALSRSLGCRANQARYLALWRRSAVVDYFPIKLDIEKCRPLQFSLHHTRGLRLRNGQRAADLSLDAFRRLLDDQNQAPLYNIQFTVIQFTVDLPKASGAWSNPHPH